MKKQKIIGYGYVGEWGDGTIGWNVPQFLVDDQKCEHPEIPMTNEWNKNTEAFLCKITIERVEIKGKWKKRKIK